MKRFPPTVSVEAAAAVLGIGRTTAYDLIARDEFPVRVIRLGRIRVLTVPLATLLGVSPDHFAEEEWRSEKGHR